MITSHPHTDKTLHGANTILNTGFKFDNTRTLYPPIVSVLQETKTEFIIIYY